VGIQYVSLQTDFKGDELRILRTSGGVTGGREQRVELVSGESGKTSYGERLVRFDG